MDDNEQEGEIMDDNGQKGDEMMDDNEQKGESSQEPNKKRTRGEELRWQPREELYTEVRWIFFGVLYIFQRQKRFF